MGSGILRGGNLSDAELEKVSEFMDGMSDAYYDVLAERGDLQERWNQYHLIGDVLRSEALSERASTLIYEKVCLSLKKEPLFLPVKGAAERATMQWLKRHTAGGAAAVAAVLVVTWLVLPSMSPRQDSSAVQVAQPVQETLPATARLPVVSVPVAVQASTMRTGQMGPYFMAHQHGVFGRAELLGSGGRSAQDRSGSEE